MRASKPPRRWVLVRPTLLAALVAASLLAGCSYFRRGGTPDNEPTLRSLSGRQIVVAKDEGITGTDEEVIAAYNRFLKATPEAQQRQEAERRLGDLEMDNADARAAVAETAVPAPVGRIDAKIEPKITAALDTKADATLAAPGGTKTTAKADAKAAPLASTTALANAGVAAKTALPANAASAAAASAGLRAPVDGATDYRTAIARYREFLQRYPQDPGNDRVIYQIARAEEQGGDLEGALKSLDRLVRDYPRSSYVDEAQFRRGELLFTARDYVKAGEAYTQVLNASGSNPYRQRSLYMQGWSYFKQSRLEESLHSFFGVLDLKLGERDDDTPLDEMKGLTRADRELIEDTFRVTGLALQNLQGAESIPAYINSPVRQRYEVRVYQQLGELYLKQERIKDAADTFAAFARLHPLNAQAPLLQARVIDIYAANGFDALALDAKRQYVASYGQAGSFRSANPAAWQRAQPLVKTHLTELARYYHASAQKSKAPADYQEAVRWYRALLASFPNDPQLPQTEFLLADALFESGQFMPAAAEYEKTAYELPAHPKSADAGYAALQSYAAQQKRVPAAEQPALQRAGIDSALRFAQAFPNDPRVAAVLTNTAETLFALHDAGEASTVGQRVLALRAPATPASPAQRRVVSTVIAHTAFERNDFVQAERAYTEVLALTPMKDPGRAELNERLAASVYKQGEQARAAGKQQEAVAQFARVASLAPDSSVRATAQYDAAASQIVLKDWDGAIRTLEDFRQRYPGHPLQEQVAPKLAVAYLEKGRGANAAPEFERIAASSKDPQQARAGLWQAAELYDKAGARAPATKAYERYLALYPQPLDAAEETRARLARLAHEDGNAARELALMRETLAADQNGGAARTPRTRALGAAAALAVAQPVVDDYKRVALVEPLAVQLKLKKAKLEDALKAYAVAADYGVADVSTAATFQTAALYQDFGRAMLDSQRPKKLSKAELEQYTVLLEEQAFPFEEKATELHEVNAKRAASGLYDQWVRKSFAALTVLRPLRYGKVERGDSEANFARTRNADPAAQRAFENGNAAARAGRVEEAVAGYEQAVRQAGNQPAYFNQLGIAYRQQGQFSAAQSSYETAIALDANDAAAILNLGILHDLYLADAPRALELYARYQTSVPGGDATVAKWIADLKNRKPAQLAAAKEKP